MEKMTPARMLLLAKHLRNNTLKDEWREGWATALEAHVVAVEFEEEVEIERIRRKLQAARDTARDAG